MKGIILAGGSGSRLYPITLGISKQLMPIYDKPMIYYPLTTLLESGISEILIITTPKDQQSFQDLLGDGSQLGCTFKYAVQPTPDGLAQAFIIGEKFLNGDSVCLVLGDNIFYGSGLDTKLKNTRKDITEHGGGAVFAYQVSDPQRYGVVDFDDNFNAISIEEKPLEPKSNYAIPGIYFFDGKVTDIAKQVKPSERGELEITEIHNAYLKNNTLRVTVMDRGTAWLDTGTFDSMNQASQFVQVIEERQGLKIGCIEEAAWRQKFISNNQMKELAKPLIKSGYGKYLEKLVNSEK